MTKHWHNHYQIEKKKKKKKKAGKKGVTLKVVSGKKEKRIVALMSVMGLSSHIGNHVEL